MATEGIEAVFLETHHWGKAAKFFQALGYELEFETDHNSDQLRNGDRPDVFVAEDHEDRPTGMQLVLGVRNAEACDTGPVVELVAPFEPKHWPTQQTSVRGPDGRPRPLQAPIEG